MIIRTVVPQDEPGVAPTLLAAQHTAYAIEATLLGDDRIPALHETVDELAAARLHWLAAFVDGELVGAIGRTQTAHEVDIDRLVVAPAAHRRGIGTELVRAILEHAGTRRVVVSTGRDNVAARALYERSGFVRVDDHEVLPGLWVTRCVRG